MMEEPEKPFACTMAECGMTFTNEDHLHVHTRKHDMVLQLGIEQKSAFVADQTPTPTRFMRNCEEVGLFQDLQNVNPFDETFKRAMETKTILSLEHPIGTAAPDDVLHTPQMVFPLVEAGDSALFSSTNNQRNITISRSSSDETGAVTEYETTTISKLTNKVTTISRVVGKPDVTDKVVTTDETKTTVHEEMAHSKDAVNETVSYTNNVVIQSNVEIKKDSGLTSIERPVAEQCKTNHVDTTKLMVPELKVPPIMSQKSLDFVVDSLATDGAPEVDKDVTVKKRAPSDKDEDSDEEYEIIIKLPSGKSVRMKSVEDKVQENAKEKLKKVLASKAKRPRVDNVKKLDPPIMLPISGTLIPVVVNPVRSSIVIANAPKVPIPPLARVNPVGSTVRRRPEKRPVSDKSKIEDSDCVIIEDKQAKRRKESSQAKEQLESRCAASKRYRERLKESMAKTTIENSQLKQKNLQLAAENAVLKMLVNEHIRKCSNADDLRAAQNMSTIIM